MVVRGVDRVMRSPTRTGTSPMTPGAPAVTRE